MKKATDTARLLAECWLAGPWTHEGLRARTTAARGRTKLPKTLESLLLGVFLDLRDRPSERRVESVARILDAHPGFRRLSRRTRLRPVVTPTRMSDGLRPWPVPPLDTVSALASWLGVESDELEWLADPHGIANHYLRRWRGTRLVEAPGPRLKRVQRRIEQDLLSCIPVHDAAHGFVSGRSVLSAVEPHVGQPMLFVTDCRAFFPSLRVQRVFSVFHAAGYPESVAKMLTWLCTTRARILPKHGAVSLHEASRFRARHVPQGAPTSPALANLCAYRLDARLSGLTQRFGGAQFTRYADDLIFSGPNELGRPRFEDCVRRIVESEGFSLHDEKTRRMPRSTRQQALGLVVNERPSLPRAERERLEACLWNCVRHGPSTQDREGVVDFRAHMTGRVAWARFVDPARSAKLEALLDRVDWHD